MTAPADARLWQAFAQLLEYPAGDVSAAARRCAALLPALSPGAATVLERFAVFAQAGRRGEVEEAYTRTFDLETTRCPYVGFHLFGESYKRSVFLLRLKAEARALGLEAGRELADHLAVCLRLLAATGDDAFRTELAVDAVLPALGRMLDGVRPERASGYLAVLAALRLALEACYPAGAAGRRELAVAPAAPSAP